MASVSKFLQRLFNFPHRAATYPRGPDFSRFAEGDRVLVDGKKLSGPLHTNHRIELPRGYIQHHEIIGRSPRVFVTSNAGQKHQITYPSLEQYVALTPRKVTPVYASYASLIVSLLDIHVAAPTTSNKGDPPLEILESGTGHGALTLHLAKAVHAANPPPPSLPPPKLDQAPSGKSTTQGARPEEASRQAGAAAEWAAYRASRRAIVHSVEISPAYSAHAQKLIHQFRRGMYAPHIDFHVTNIGDWINSRLNPRHHPFSFSRTTPDMEPFLSYVILDMPASHLQIASVAPAMKDGALLVVFVPSVTQVGDCVRIIQDNGVRLQLENVLELGEGISNGRVWDVRLVRKRARSDDARPAQREEDMLDEKGAAKVRTSASEKDAVDGGTDGLRNAEIATSHDESQVMVCRPKVGKMTIGGGFIGLWRKLDSAG